MKRDEHPLLAADLQKTQLNARQVFMPLAQVHGPIAKVVELMNARNYCNQAEASKSYEEFCNTMQKLHNEKTFVPPVCLTWLLTT